MSALFQFVPRLLANNITLFENPVRTIIRVHFPRPDERKRILKHGWKKRMSTPAGRRVLMNRILKGKHVYSH